MKFSLVAMLALVLSACGGKAPDGNAANKPSGNAPVPAFGGDDAVAAVRETPGTPVAQLRFVIDTRPVAGEPFRMQLIVSAVQPIPRLVVRVESTVLRVDTSSVELSLAESGGSAAYPYSASHDFTASAQQEGLTELTVRLVAEADTPETVYVIPVLVAKAGADAGAVGPASYKPDPAAKGDNGQP